jgi:hypothetical protein
VLHSVPLGDGQGRVRGDVLIGEEPHLPVALSPPEMQERGKECSAHPAPPLCVDDLDLVELHLR